MDNALTYSGLVPAITSASSGITWDTLLKFTKARLELLTDINKRLFIGRGLRGGISIASRRFAVVSNLDCLDYGDKQLKYVDLP